MGPLSPAKLVPSEVFRYMVASLVAIMSVILIAMRSVGSCSVCLASINALLMCLSSYLHLQSVLAVVITCAGRYEFDTGHLSMT